MIQIINDGDEKYCVVCEVDDLFRMLSVIYLKLTMLIPVAFDLIFVIIYFRPLFSRAQLQN
jgi:hypothetical protein